MSFYFNPNYVITSCSTIKQLEIFSKPIERQPLALEDPVTKT